MIDSGRERPYTLKNGHSRAVPFLILLIVFLIPLMIAIRVVALGFLPADDALRHAAKVVSGKEWNEILVLRDDITMDSHPGWHALLGMVHSLTGAEARPLVYLSVLFLFFLFCAVPVFFLKRPEAWLLTLLVILLASAGAVLRLFAGRPPPVKL